MTAQSHADPSAVQRRANKVARDVTALLATVEHLAAERDAARAAQIALEQEGALKDEALAEMRALHNEWTNEDGFRICAHCASMSPEAPKGNIFSDTAYPCDSARILDALAARLSAHLFPTDEKGANDE